MLLQQLRKVNSHPQLSGELLGGSPNGRGLVGKGSLDRNLLGGLPPIPFVGLYGWLAFDPKIFMPPWYPPVATKPTSKLPYQKLQY